MGAQLGRSAAGQPAADHRLRRLRVELGGEHAPGADEVRAGLRAGQLDEAFWHGEHVVVPHQPRPSGRHAGVGRQLQPPDLRRRRAGHRAAERVGEHLGAEADGDQRDLGGHGGPHEGGLGIDELGRRRLVHVPFRSQREHELHAVEPRPAVGMLAVQLRERVAMLAQAVADEAGIEVRTVADDQGAHAVTVSIGGRAHLGAVRCGFREEAAPVRRLGRIAPDVRGREGWSPGR